ncbi:hypothetical protein B0H66DRAFT_622771 [Apodospora peruviana]|uniref:LysM domain-containing protein n=1 Tax=Apodospora peruviana TaxID=516989 RepID=A0AAE0M5K6_9PEZI|nr:hypothetical protein B0H66DRAFT_622771 [Apodospora peruviana]
MMLPPVCDVLLLALISTIASVSANRIQGDLRRGLQNAIPKYPYEETTTRFCAWWLDNDGSWTCPMMEETYGVAMADFHRWRGREQNPSVAIPCTTLPSNQSYCIAAYEAPSLSRTRVPFPPPTLVTVTVPYTVPVTVPMTVPVTTVLTSVFMSTVTAVRTTSVYPTPSAGGNGITTPVPYQPGMVGNCKTFYFVQQGDTCVNIAAKYNVSTDQLIAWNPFARSDCTKLLANTYCCVGVL